MTTKVAVTGANGHVGSVLVLHLLRHGYAVRACVRKFKDRECWQFLADAGAEVIELDILNKGQLDLAFKNVQGVFHVAAPNLTHSSDSEREIFLPIVEGTKNVVAAGLENSVRKMIYVSSCAAIGFKAPKQRSLNENDWGSENVPSFAKAKIIAERKAWDIVGNQSTMEFISVCPPAVIGPGFRRHTPATKGYEYLVRGFFPPIPRMNFHFVDVRDLAELQRLLYESSSAKGRYIAAGPYFTARDLISFLKNFDPTLKIFPWTIPGWVLKLLVPVDRVNALFKNGTRELTWELAKIVSHTDQRVDSSKARALGWKTREFSATVADTIAWTRVFCAAKNRKTLDQDPFKDLKSLF